MLLVLLGIVIVLMIVSVILTAITYEKDNQILSLIFGFLIIIFIAMLFVICCTTIDYSGKIKKSSYISSKIEILENENTRMEQDINTAIQKYCEYEHKTYTELKPNEINFVFVLYPELKSSELVVSYIDTITQNRNEIKSLKLEYEDSKVYKWWVYFGG